MIIIKYVVREIIIFRGIVNILLNEICKERRSKKEDEAMWEKKKKLKRAGGNALRLPGVLEGYDLYEVILLLLLRSKEYIIKVSANVQLFGSRN